jgi:hypothetical protein
MSGVKNREGEAVLAMIFERDGRGKEEAAMARSRISIIICA